MSSAQHGRPNSGAGDNESVSEEPEEITRESREDLIEEVQSMSSGGGGHSKKKRPLTDMADTFSTSDQELKKLKLNTVATQRDQHHEGGASSTVDAKSLCTSD